MEGNLSPRQSIVDTNLIRPQESIKYQLNNLGIISNYVSRFILDEKLQEIYQEIPNFIMGILQVFTP